MTQPLKDLLMEIREEQAQYLRALRPADTSHPRESTFMDMHTTLAPPEWDNPHDFISVV